MSRAETPALGDALHWRRGGGKEPAVDVWIGCHPAQPPRGALVVVQCHLPKRDRPETVRLSDGRFVTKRDEAPWHRFRPPHFEPGMPEGSTVRFYGAATFNVAADYGGGDGGGGGATASEEADSAAASAADAPPPRWALGMVHFHSYGFVREGWPVTKSPLAMLPNPDAGKGLSLPVRVAPLPSAGRRADREWRDANESKYQTDDFQHLCVRDTDGALRSHGPFAHANESRVPWRAGGDAEVMLTTRSDLRALLGFHKQGLRRTRTTRW